MEEVSGGDDKENADEGGGGDGFEFGAGHFAENGGGEKGAGHNAAGGVGQGGGGGGGGEAGRGGFRGAGGEGGDEGQGGHDHTAFGEDAAEALEGAGEAFLGGDFGDAEGEAGFAVGLVAEVADDDGFAIGLGELG